MAFINKHDINGTKGLLAKGELGYDDYSAGGDTGRVYVGTGSVNIPQAKKAEVIAVDGKVDTHTARADNPHSVTKTQVGLGNVQNVDTTNASNITSGTLANVRLANSGVTAGTYKSVTVDGKGIVTGGTNPNTLSGYSITDAYTKTETNTQISTAVAALVDSSPGTLDTLNELAAALGDDPNFATTTANAIAAKVPKVTSTDNAIVRFDGTNGDVQNSGVIIDDNGNVGIGTSIVNAKLDVRGTNKSNVISVGVSNTSYQTYIDVTTGEVRLKAVDTNSSNNAKYFTFYTQPPSGTANEKMKIDWNGNVLLTSGTGGLGYGIGAGISVTQDPSSGKSTSVTANKPTGQIIMNNAALAAGAIIQFNLLNSLVSPTDCVEITLRQSSSVVPVLIELTWAVENGLVQIGVRNNHTSALGEALVLNFTIVKGANS